MSAIESEKAGERGAPDLSFLERPAPRAPEIPNFTPAERGTDRGDISRSRDRHTAGKVLTVGRGISVSGEISECDTLVNEGTVEADMAAGRMLDIAPGGRFNGRARVDEALIDGAFDGDLIVRGKLRIRANGLVTGSVRYGQLEIETGGELNGDVSIGAA
ncbi:MAG: polymer-forming cytoskeletal protein, partial [Alphaproteobacteria bacterium]